MSLSHAWFFICLNFICQCPCIYINRSLCSVTAKWTYTKNKQFDEEFYKAVGLGDLCDNSFEKIGNSVNILTQFVFLFLITIFTTLKNQYI